MTDGAETFRDTENNSPQPAMVIPRGHQLHHECSLPIDRLLAPLIQNASKGIVLIVAPPGGGGTTALRHLRAALPSETDIGLFDVNEQIEALKAASFRLVVMTGLKPGPGDDFVDVIELSPWTLDDCLEYLAVAHRPQCASVMKRLAADESIIDLGGSPQLLTRAMDAMAADPSLPDARAALHQFVDKMFPDGPNLSRLILGGPNAVPLNDEQLRWWRHGIIQRICTANWLASRLNEGIVPKLLQSMETAGAFIPEVANLIRNQPPAIDCLERFLKDPRPAAAGAVAASLLLAVDSNWRPADGKGIYLYKAHLAGAKWDGLDLTGAVLIGANLAGADLSEACLDHANFDQAELTRANLRNAQIGNGSFVGTNLTSADLSEVCAVNANFADATMESARLSRGDFRDARFKNCNWTDALAESAHFCGAWIRGGEFQHADFTAADFSMSHFYDMDMSDATWTGASFSKAGFHACNLEFLILPSANFHSANLSGCLLTGSQIPGGNFFGANLRSAGLADIDWEDADLRQADLTHASFHMGSSRSGLVGSNIPCEGSRTGFYTDDFNDQSYKPAEDIRKACLCGANLTGADVERTDFYLVDLRRAVYTEKQARHFVKSGAILR